jgi:hypothetical protein
VVSTGATWHGHQRRVRPGMGRRAHIRSDGKGQQVSIYNSNQVDQMAQGLDQEIQSAKRRPVLFGLFALAAVIFAIWYMTGGSAVGSPHQAEHLILTNQSPYGTATPAQTVHCTQNSQSLFARLRGLIGGGNTNDHPVSTDPQTVYTCSGTTATGQAAYWCVTFPPRDNQYGLKPEVSGRQVGMACPN